MLQIMVYLYPSLQWGIGPSSFSHVENCGSKDPIVSFFFRRFSIYSVEPFRSRPIWALLVFIWPMFLSLFRESTTAKHREGKIHKREKDTRVWMWVLPFSYHGHRNLLKQVSQRCLGFLSTSCLEDFIVVDLGL